MAPSAWKFAQSIRPPESVADLAIVVRLVCYSYLSVAVGVFTPETLADSDF